jgi:hypothetical protein
VSERETSFKTVGGEVVKWTNELMNDGIVTVTRAVSDASDEVATCALEEIALEQEKDDDIHPILAMKKRAVAKPIWDEVAPLSPVAKALWQQWEQLQFRNGILCRRFEFADGRPSVCKPLSRTRYVK